MKVSLQEACQLLRSSSLVAIPTETVWGIAACFDNDAAIQKIYDVKKRPKQNPLIIHVHDFSAIIPLVKMPLPPKTVELVQRFWPGPLTLVLPIQEDKIPPTARAGLPTAAFRVPAHEGTRRLLQVVGPLVAPSANLSGKPSATEYSAVESDFGCQFPCYISSRDDESILPLHGIESTILVWNESVDKSRTGWSIGRLGSLSVESIVDILGDVLIEPHTSEFNLDTEKPICPGQTFRHYAPEAHLDIGYVEGCESNSSTIIGFSDKTYPKAHTVFILGNSTDSRGCLRNLYKTLRALDENNISHAWIDARLSKEDLQKDPLWYVFFDRIQKAAKKS